MGKDLRKEYARHFLNLVKSNFSLDNMIKKYEIFCRNNCAEKEIRFEGNVRPVNGYEVCDITNKDPMIVTTNQGPSRMKKTDIQNFQE